ncbi:MAG: hypothetical protein ACFHWZ_18550 [Phycisphaerales bacterium]
MQSKHATRSHYPAWRIGIVVGFATTVVMWLIAFFLHLQGLTAEPWLTGVALILAQTGGSVLAGRYASRDRTAWKLGLATGLTTSVLNLLILGSVLTEPVRVQADQAVRPDAGIMVAGYLSIGVVIGIVGAMLGSRFLASDEKTDFEDSSHDRWVTRFAWVAAFAVVPVLFTGGLTTSNQAGLAVPDWPNTYATNMFLYPVASMTGGKLYEHTHRLFGSLAGVAALGLFLYTLTAWIGAKRTTRTAVGFTVWPRCSRSEPASRSSCRASSAVSELCSPTGRRIRNRGATPLRRCPRFHARSHSPPTTQPPSASPSSTGSPAS